MLPPLAVEAPVFPRVFATCGERPELLLAFLIIKRGSSPMTRTASKTIFSLNKCWPGGWSSVRMLSMVSFSEFLTPLQLGRRRRR